MTTGTLGIGPSGQWGADVDRLTAFYSSLGFVDNPQPHELFRVSDAMIREPAGEKTQPANSELDSLWLPDF